MRKFPLRKYSSRDTQLSAYTLRASVVRTLQCLAWLLCVHVLLYWYVYTCTVMRVDVNICPYKRPMVDAERTPGVDVPQSLDKGLFGHPRFVEFCVDFFGVEVVVDVSVCRQ